MNIALGEAQDVVLRLTRITKRFGPLVANDHISLELRRGEVVALLGENGAGKTTLMNILFGHYVADEGSVEAFGHPLPPGNPRAALQAGIGMVHQHFTLADNLSVMDNIRLGTEPLFSHRSGRAAAKAKSKHFPRDFSLAVHPDARVGSLTVGERQRVGNPQGTVSRRENPDPRRSRQPCSPRKRRMLCSTRCARPSRGGSPSYSFRTSCTR